MFKLGKNSIVKMSFRKKYSRKKAFGENANGDLNIGENIYLVNNLYSVDL